MKKSNKCPSCGSTLSFNPSTNSLHCGYCGGNYKVDSVAVTNEKRPYTTNAKFQETTMAQYHCSSCGSNLNIYKDEEVKRCPNCGSIDLQKTNNISLVPDAIIPFAISKEKATENFNDWIKHRKFAPKDLKKLAKMGKLSGLYTPVWNFDCNTSTSYSGVGVNEHKDKNGEVHEERKHFSGSFSSVYNDITITANKQISTRTLLNLGDWDMSNLKVYNTEYLCGFIGADIDFDIHESFKSFNNYINRWEKNKAENSCGSYDRIENFSVHTHIYNQKYNYIYLPIWANYYTYKNKKYSCYINGHSGKVTGTAPKSFWKIFFLVLGITLVAAAVGFGIYMLVNSNTPDLSPSIPSDFPTPRIRPDTGGFSDIQQFSL